MTLTLIFKWFTNERTQSNAVRADYTGQDLGSSVTGDHPGGVLSLSLPTKQLHDNALTIFLIKPIAGYRSAFVESLNFGWAYLLVVVVH